MSKVLPVLAIVGGLLALLGAMVLVPETAAPVLLALFGLVAAGFLIARRDLPGFVTGGAAIVLVVVGMLGASSGFYFGSDDASEESRGAEFGISPLLGQALLIIACLMPAAALVWTTWGQQPSWLAIGATVALAISALLALVLHGSLVDGYLAAGYLVGLSGLLGSVAIAAGVLRAQ